MWVSDEVALVSFNDLDLAAEIDPFLTVLSQPIYWMGRIAMELLIERIQQRADGPVRDVVLSPHLVVLRIMRYGAERRGSQPAPPTCYAGDRLK